MNIVIQKKKREKKNQKAKPNSNKHSLEMDSVFGNER